MARRNPVIAALGGVLVVFMVLGSALSLLAAGHFNRLRLDADRAAGRERVARQEAEAAADLARTRGDAERWERYRSSIAAAASASHEQNSGTARIALEAAPPEHRNWEWQHFHSGLDGARLVLPVAGGSVFGLTISPSGGQIAVCCDNCPDAYLYDVATGKLDAVLRGHTARITSVLYRGDGKQVATGGWDRTIRLWDPATGRESACLRVEFGPSKMEGGPSAAYSADGRRIVCVAETRGPGTSRLFDATGGKEIAVVGEWQKLHRSAALSPDGKRVAATSEENVRLSDAVTGQRIATLGPHEGPVMLVEYSPDGKRIASVAGQSGAGAIHLWDSTTGKEVAVLRGHPAGVDRLLFSPDGSRLISGSGYPENTARLWDAASGRLLAVLAGHKNNITAVAFNANTTRAATASRDHTARLWDGRTGQMLAVLGGHTARVASVVFNPGGSRVITASDDATLRLWDAQTGELIRVLRGHGGAIACPPVFTPDSTRLVSASTDGTVRIWDVSLLERNGILRGHESFVYDVAFSPDGEQVASASWDGTVRLWRAATGRQTGLLKHETGIISSVAFSRDGRRLVTVERERGVVLWDLAAGKVLRTWPKPAAAWGGDTRAALNPKGTIVASGCADGPVRLWDVAGGEELAQLNGHQGMSIDVAFHPDGSLVASTGEDGTVRLWDVATHAARAVLRGHHGNVCRVAFSADGKLLSSSSTDQTIRLWSARTGEPVSTIGVGSVVYGLAFSPDGTRLAAGCIDNTVRLIDVGTSQPVAELRGHTDFVHAVAWSPDGTRLLSGSGDFTVRIWDALPPAVCARPADAYVPPRGYIAYRAGAPVQIDGQLDEAAWRAVPWSEDFVDIEGDRRLPPRFRTRVKMLWDDRYFYIGAELEEPHVQASYTRHDSYVFHEDNDFEVFLNPDGNNHNYAELEMNALNTTWDLRLRKPYRDGGKAEDNWELPGLKTAVHVQGTINDPRSLDKGWSIEMVIPWQIVSALNERDARSAAARRRPVAREFLARAVALRYREWSIYATQGSPRRQLGLVAAVGREHARAGDLGLRAILERGAGRRDVPERPRGTGQARATADLQRGVRLSEGTRSFRFQFGRPGFFGRRP